MLALGNTYRKMEVKVEMVSLLLLRQASVCVLSGVTPVSMMLAYGLRFIQKTFVCSYFSKMFISDN